jgi:hypothetical protein
MDRQARINAFLEGNPAECESAVWAIASDREQTKRALAEWFQEQPEAIFEQLTGPCAPVLVVAPGIQQICAEAVFNCLLEPSTTLFKSFRVAFFDRRLEECVYSEARDAVFALMGFVLSKLIDDGQLGASVQVGA